MSQRLQLSLTPAWLQEFKFHYIFEIAKNLQYIFQNLHYSS